MENPREDLKNFNLMVDSIDDILERADGHLRCELCIKISRSVAVLDLRVCSCSLNFLLQGMQLLGCKERHERSVAVGVVGVVFECFVFLF